MVEKKKEKPGFEEALKKLESIVEQLEDPDVTLEESIRLYEEGVELSRYCSKSLEEAVQRIEKINEKSESESGIDQ
ncbi:MAG: exodeoxyribonuclease VII small subunit [Balneolaceae bacterium]